MTSVLRNCCLADHKAKHTILWSPGGIIQAWMSNDSSRRQPTSATLWLLADRLSSDRNSSYETSYWLTLFKVQEQSPQLWTPKGKEPHHLGQHTAAIAGSPVVLSMRTYLSFSRAKGLPNNTPFTDNVLNDKTKNAHALLLVGKQLWQSGLNGGANRMWRRAKREGKRCAHPVLRSGSASKGEAFPSWYMLNWG